MRLTTSERIDDESGDEFVHEIVSQKDVAELQRQDVDIGSVVLWMKDGSDRPDWSTMG